MTSVTSLPVTSNNTDMDNDGAYYFACISERIATDAKVHLAYAMANASVADNTIYLQYFVQAAPFPEMEPGFLQLERYRQMPKTEDQFPKSKSIYWTRGRTPDDSTTAVTRVFVNILCPYSLRYSGLPYVIGAQCHDAFPALNFQESSLKVHNCSRKLSYFYTDLAFLRDHPQRKPPVKRQRCEIEVVDDNSANKENSNPQQLNTKRDK